MIQHSPFEKIGYLFYIVNPNKTSFENHEDIPDYIIEVVPYFLALIILEQICAGIMKKPKLRINDAIGSISQGMFQELVRLLLKSLQFAAYFYVYYNWRVITLPWNSPWTWWLCFIGVDLGYYWLHRASHEINILWAAHQVHHSSEDYNLTTALRQSALQSYLVWMFYLPLALAIPPSVFLVHTQFNTLYQFWIHTELIKSLGPLEYIFNTASHHRVHHGRNRYCIDKNYGGTLIIWDRLFGTFEPEGEKVVYGLTHPLSSFEPFYVQFCHFIHIWKTFWSMKGIKNKLSVIFKGPGWQPGTSWHGNPEDIPDVKWPAEKYDPQLYNRTNIYALLHFALILIGHIFITENNEKLPQSLAWIGIGYQLFSLTSIGMLLEGRFYAPWIEILRCILFLILQSYFLPLQQLEELNSTKPFAILTLFRVSFVTSILFWLWQGIKSIRIMIHSRKSELIAYK